MTRAKRTKGAYRNFISCSTCSATAQASKRLRASNKIILTGTPIQNRVHELWATFDFLMPNFLGSSTSFSKDFANPILCFMSYSHFHFKVKYAGGTEIIFSNIFSNNSKFIMFIMFLGTKTQKINVQK